MIDGHYPDDLNNKPEPAKPDAPAEQPGFAPTRPPEDEDLYLPPSQRSKPKWRRIIAKIIKIMLLLAVLAALAAFVYFKFFHNKKSTTPPQSTQTPASQTPKANAFGSATKNYTSSNVGLTFAYPENWNVNDTDNKLTVTSPVASLTGTDGQQFDGKILLTIQPKGATPDAFKNGGAIAALDSLKIKYAKPTPVQRGQTYLSFVQNTEKFVKGQLDGIYVTGDFGYQSNQFVPKTDIAKLDPLINIAFQKCDDSQCKSPVATSIQADQWDNNADFQKVIKSMLESIQVNE